MASTGIQLLDGPGAVSDEFGPNAGFIAVEFINDGAFTGQVVIERKDAEGLNEWVQLSRNGTPASWANSFVELIAEPTEKARYRLKVASHTSGSGRGCISQ